VAAPLRVATYNLHAGVDGWGRPTRVVDAAVALDADVLILQESWRSAHVDLAAEIAARSGATAHTYVCATGWRVTGGTGRSTWQPADALLVGNRGLYLDSEQPLSARSKARLEHAEGAERGEWCVGIVTRLDVLKEDVVELSRFGPDRARRRLVHLTLDSGHGALEAFGLHGAHLSRGSLRQYRELASTLDAGCGSDEAAPLGGDLNAWGVVVRRMLPGWRHAGRGATWPSWRPHSQLDHLFVRGPVAVADGGAVAERESDHRPMAATIVVRPSAT